MLPATSAILVLERERAPQAFERSLGVFIAQCGGLLIESERRCRIFRPGPAGFRVGAQPLESAGMIKGGGFLKQRLGCFVIFRPTVAILHHHPKLKHRFGGVRGRRFREPAARFREINRHADAGAIDRSETGHAGSIAGGCGLFEKLARFGGVGFDA
jgi:hypothetical protein